MKLVIVEDQLSAMRLWHLGFSAVALLGTTLSPDKWDEISAYASKVGADVYLALDADATSRAIGYAKRYGVEVVRLEQDIKDMSSDSQIRALFSKDGVDIG